MSKCSVLDVAMYKVALVMLAKKETHLICLGFGKVRISIVQNVNTLVIGYKWKHSLGMGNLTNTRQLVYL